MFTRHLVIIFAFVLLFQVNIVFAQNPYIREGPIGKQKEQTKEQIKTPQIDPRSFRPIEKWVGEKFIFLPESKHLQKFQYSSFKDERRAFGQLTYEECVGRIGTIIEATDRYPEKIKIQMDDNGQIYTGRGSGSIDGIAPVADIDHGRTNWIGKTLWYTKGEILTYNEDTGKFGTVKLKKYSPVKVIDVVAGWYESRPIRLILQTTSGEEGFKEVHLSGTNVPLWLQVFNRFDDYFLTENPRVTYKWSERVWNAIEEEKVFIGMTAEQARMSWGKPEKINRTTRKNLRFEQWVYGNRGYLYLENGVVTSIQN